MKKWKVLLALFLGVSAVDAESLNKNIRLNQLGYYPSREKIIVIEGEYSGEFSIVDKDGKSVFIGELQEGGFSDVADVKTTIADFSSLKDEGEYFIKLSNGDKSYDFKISKDIYKDALNASVKAYYYNRASSDIESSYGGKWARNGGHWDKNLSFHSSAGGSGNIDVSGGWYDAGDYGKYIVNGGISVSTLMGLYEIYPEIVGDDLNIPESNNDKSDLYDEIKWEIDWFNKMQATDGGVYFKVASLDWSWDVMPENDQFASGRVVIGKSTTSTLNFSASMAQAYRVYKDDSYLEKAKDAWKWALKNPDKSHVQVMGSGDYGDDDYSDEFLWAASELYVSTGDSEYKDYIQKEFAKSDTIYSPSSWQDVRAMAFFNLAINKTKKVDKEISEIAKKSIIKKADLILEAIKASAFKIPMQEDDFVWGSNGVIGNYGIITSYAYYLSKDVKYLNATSAIADYIFGKNATGYSFMTGYGELTPMQIHHRQSKSDGINDPVPGFVAGGPQSKTNPSEENVSYPSKFPAKCYSDVWGSYSTNEVTINWNAPTVFMLATLQQNNSVDTSLSINDDYSSFEYDNGTFLKIAPTPFKKKVKLIYNFDGSKKKTTLNIYNINEEVILSTTIDAKQNNQLIDASEFREGIYFFEVIQDGKRVAIERSVKI